jgi:hypothetical protein
MSTQPQASQEKEETERAAPTKQTYLVQQHEFARRGHHRLERVLAIVTAPAKNNFQIKQLTQQTLTRPAPTNQLQDKTLNNRTAELTTE